MTTTEVAIPLSGDEAEALRAMVEKRCQSPGAAPGDFSLLSRLESGVLQAQAKQQWEIISARLAAALDLLDDLQPASPTPGNFVFLGQVYAHPDPAFLSTWFEQRRVALHHGHHLRTRIIALERELAHAQAASDQNLSPFLARAEKELARVHAILDAHGVPPGDLLQRFQTPPDPDILGQIVREAWVKWAKNQPDPKPSHLLPYADISEEDREADRQIGMAVFCYITGSHHPECPDECDE